MKTFEDSASGENNDEAANKRKRDINEPNETEQPLKKPKTFNPSSILEILKYVLDQLIMEGKVSSGFLEVDQLLQECKKYKSTLSKEDIVNVCKEGALGDQYWYDDDTEKLYTNSL